MSPVQKPSKEVVRQWLIREVAAKSPPPSPDEIRRMLGWHMLQNNDTKTKGE